MNPKIKFVTISTAITTIFAILYPFFPSIFRFLVLFSRRVAGVLSDLSCGNSCSGDHLIGVIIGNLILGIILGLLIYKIKNRKDVDPHFGITDFFRIAIYLILLGAVAEVLVTTLHI